MAINLTAPPKSKKELARQLAISHFQAKPLLQAQITAKRLKTES